ncbi:hypothetical protein [Mesorhizobium sp. CAU 1741]|uniref:hypothetical protein n=1 Tax=Mesorhizobium sp. CAU 1741 TaxID=3140366 RepID=UPI00325BC4EB
MDMKDGYTIENVTAWSRKRNARLDAMHPPEGTFLPNHVLEVLFVALRYAATEEGRHLQCSRRDCRRLGRCHAVPTRKGGIECPGGITGRAVERAVDMMAFVVAAQTPQWRDGLAERLPRAPFRLNRKEEEGEG